MSLLTETPEHDAGTRWWSPWQELLSSMRFAIALLTVICIASVIGTVLKQHEPLTNYVNQFGPFWAEVFDALNLYSVYSAWWFLLILAFLVTSTSLCIARNTPKILTDLRVYKENIREQSLRAFHHKAEGQLAEAPEVAAQRLGQLLATGGWKVKLQSRGTGWMRRPRPARPTSSGTSLRTVPSCWCAWAACSMATWWCARKPGLAARASTAGVA